MNREPKVKYKIYLERSNGRCHLPGGYFMHQGSRVNHYIYDRTSDPNDSRIILYESKEHCAAVMEDMQRLGYKCRAEPPFTVTKSY